MTRRQVIGFVVVLALIGAGLLARSRGGSHDGLRALRQAAALQPCPPGIGTGLPDLRLDCLAGGKQVPLRAAGPGVPMLVNLWATWCPPCIEELPRLKQLVEELNHGGTDISLQLVSVDTTAAAVEAFAAKHPEVAGSPRLADPMTLEAWLATIGLDKGATLPVHVFVGADGKVACARTGAVRESDLPAIKKLLAKVP